MKKLFTIFTITLFSVPATAQWNEIDFEGPISPVYQILFDNVSNPNCKWQIGVPNKAVFQSAYSVEHALLTDTLNPVPANDTSAFVLKLALDPFGPYHILGLSFWYQMDGDTSDFGKIEISPDGGATWIDVLTEETSYEVVWLEPKPTLNGSTGGWQYFSFNNFTDWSLATDTVLYRFTYITDSGSTLHDGWMIDDISPMQYWEGVVESQDNNLISISPNPASNQLRINRIKSDENAKIQIVNQLGEVVVEEANFVGESIDVGALPSGIYFIRYANGKSFSVEKFIVQHE
jgi:hypothetical protein